MMSLSSGSPACHCYPGGFKEFFDEHFHASRITTNNSVGWVSFHNQITLL